MLYDSQEMTIADRTISTRIIVLITKNLEKIRKKINF